MEPHLQLPSRRLSYTMVCYFLSTYTYSILSPLADSLFYFELLGVCGTRQSSNSFPAVFYGPAAFEFFVFALTVWRGVQDARIITGTGGAPFLAVLYRGEHPPYLIPSSLLCTTDRIGRWVHMLLRHDNPARMEH
jgi:hypothetical protein